MPELSVRPAHDADRSVMERLWLMFQHDMSEFRGLLPFPDGTFRSERLQAALHDTDWAAYLLTSAERPVGFALVRGLTGGRRVLSSFFVVRGARRTGIGLRAAQEVIAGHPGRWEIAFQDDNATAVRFWRRVATAVAPDAWTEERRPVPTRPQLPPDVWISFEVSGIRP
ncbi:GNAT family N-acetyltransferase [Actinomadura xylanilytica]|uniref:GNAT family N-acetyltransferase n=1 Tax=Actinomadura xylanilytica TaxID=887459 RepID=UPI00255B2198|nr:GNAT family N-acetyltransferase [Actinomadura xylanilytica]MDL4770786.1 GNAT family N-acetyltransferase [Actinomadura xylanilytica]